MRNIGYCDFQTLVLDNMLLEQLPKLHGKFWSLKHPSWQRDHCAVALPLLSLGGGNTAGRYLVAWNSLEIHIFRPMWLKWALWTELWASENPPLPGSYNPTKIPDYQDPAWAPFFSRDLISRPVSLLLSIISPLVVTLEDRGLRQRERILHCQVERSWLGWETIARLVFHQVTDIMAALIFPSAPSAE